MNLVCDIYFCPRSVKPTPSYASSKVFSHLEKKVLDPVWVTWDQWSQTRIPAEAPGDPVDFGNLKGSNLGFIHCIQVLEDL